MSARTDLDGRIARLLSLLLKRRLFTHTRDGAAAAVAVVEVRVDGMVVVEKFVASGVVGGKFIADPSELT